jgi:hypothetical protein
MNIRGLSIGYKNEGSRGFTITEVIVTVVTLGLFLTAVFQWYQLIETQRISVLKQSVANEIADINLRKFPKVPTSLITCSASQDGIDLTSHNNFTAESLTSYPSASVLGGASSSTTNPISGVTQTVKAFPLDGCIGTNFISSALKVESRVTYPGGSIYRIGYIDGATPTPLPAIVTDGLVLNLDAGNTSSYPGTGTTWTDLSGNGRNANVNGNPAFTNGYFDITSDITYISLSNVGLVPRTNDFTYSTWINFDAIDGLDTIFENGSWTDTLLFRYQTNLVAVYSEGALRGTFSWAAGTGVWYNVVFKREGGTCSMYINNVLTGAQFTMNLDINLANTNLFLMRSQHTTNNQFTNGKMATFSIYDRALTASEIQQNFDALKTRFGL